MKYTSSTVVPHPASADGSFGTIPKIYFKQHHFPKGKVYLLYGRRNFGAAHIFNRHKNEMKQRGFNTISEVPNFVATIVNPYAPLHLEGGDQKHKLAVVQSSSGTAILQLRSPLDGEPYYSVVTAYLGFNKHGPRVGKIL